MEFENSFVWEGTSGYKEAEGKVEEMRVVEEGKSEGEVRKGRWKYKVWEREVWDWLFGHCMVRPSSLICTSWFSSWLAILTQYLGHHRHSLQPLPPPPHPRLPQREDNPHHQGQPLRLEVLHDEHSRHHRPRTSVLTVHKHHPSHSQHDRLLRAEE
jgi:hypothetical protein